MKKVSALLALMLVLSLSVVAAANWADGSYEAWSDAGARSTQYAKVFISDGKITGVQLREYTDRLIEKDMHTYSWEEFRTAVQTMGLQFMEAQSTEVDGVTGATSSSNGFKQAVERALVKASGNADQEYFDGVFLGRSHYSGRQYYSVVWVTLKNDQITDIKVQRVLSDNSIQDPAEYNWPLEAARAQYAELAIAQNSGNLDTISGATGLTDMLNIAVQDALDRARIR